MDIKPIKVCKRYGFTFLKATDKAQKKTDSLNDAFPGYLCIGQEMLPVSLRILFFIDHLGGLSASTIIPKWDEKME